MGNSIENLNLGKIASGPPWFEKKKSINQLKEIWRTESVKYVKKSSYK